MSAKTQVDLEAEDPPVLIPVESPPRRGGFHLRHLMYVTLYCALVCWLGVMTGLVLISGVLGLAFAIAFGGVLIYARRRSTQQDSLLWALATAAERGMPLAPTLDAFAGQCWGGYRRRVVAAAYDLRQGYSLPQVLDREPGLFPREAEVLCRAGHDAGVLGAALREASALRARTRGPWIGVAIRISYLVGVLLVLQSVGGFVTYFIIPKYEAIFNDFGIPLPSVTLAVIDVSHLIVRFWPLFFLLFALQFGLLMLTSVSVLGVLPWDLPLVGRFFLRRHAALVLRCLARVVEGEKPLAQGIARLAGTYPVLAIRRRLQRAGQDIKQGDDWREALVRGGLIRPPEAALLEAAERVGNLPWALREAAEASERRFSYRLQSLALWVLPLCVLALGAVVFVVVVAYFAPLVMLIERLA